MKISVAMASYNGEEFIERQLETIRDQTRMVDEVIISDDASKDNTVGIIKEFITENGLNWKLLTNEGDHGVKSNFYNALANTQGDIVVLCDQDDVWEKDKIESIEKAFEQKKDILSLNSSFCYIDEKENLISTKLKGNKANNNLIPQKLVEGKFNKIPFQFVINKNISPGMTMAVSRKIVDIYLKYSNRSFLHDHELNCIAAMFGGLYFYDEKLVKYRIHENQTVSISNIHKTRLKDKFLKKMDEVISFVPAQQRFLDEMAKIVPPSPKNIDVLKDVVEYNEIRNEVINGNSGKWLKEIAKAVECKKKGIYIDLRYCLIDFAASIWKEH